MKEIIINLINKWACCHDWQLVRETRVETDFGGSYVSLIFVCKKCGKFKTLKTNLG
jgi:hypothetical protein